jgi:glycosyltransferase involved in cell wall biosynthesis
MRILVDGDSAGSGGYLRHLRGVLTARPPQDVAITLLCSRPHADRLGRLGDHVRVLTPPELGDPRRRVRRAWRLTRFPALVREVRPDVLLHARGFVSGRAGAVPRVVIHHNISPFHGETYRLYGPSMSSVRNLAVWTAQASGFLRADGVAFVGEPARDRVTRQVPGIRRHTVTGNATPDDYLDLPVAARRALPDQVRVLCVSTHYMSKYPWNVVHGVCDARERTGLDLRLHLVGGGDRRTGERLRAAVQERHAASFVTVHGDVAEERMPAVYADADVFVFPSTQETWPITLLEAMATGLPIACSNRMPMPQMLKDGGVYFDPVAPASLASALGVLLADGDLRVRCGQRAQAYARQNQWQASADRLFDFLRTIVESDDRARTRPGTPAELMS